jgi:hypothetical protein
VVGVAAGAFAFMAATMAAMGEVLLVVLVLVVVGFESMDAMDEVPVVLALVVVGFESMDAMDEVLDGAVEVELVEVFGLGLESPVPFLM